MAYTIFAAIWIIGQLIIILGLVFRECCKIKATLDSKKEKYILTKFPNICINTAIKLLISILAFSIPTMGFIDNSLCMIILGEVIFAIALTVLFVDFGEESDPCIGMYH